MEKVDFVDKIKLFVNHVKSESFGSAGGKALFLKDAEQAIDFVDSHRIENRINLLMFNDLKSKFDSLVERTRFYEKKT